MTCTLNAPLEEEVVTLGTVSHCRVTLSCGSESGHSFAGVSAQGPQRLCPGDSRAASVWRGHREGPRARLLRLLAEFLSLLVLPEACGAQAASPVGIHLPVSLRTPSWGQSLSPSPAPQGCHTHKWPPGGSVSCKVLSLLLTAVYPTTPPPPGSPLGVLLPLEPEGRSCVLTITTPVSGVQGRGQRQSGRVEIVAS